VLTILLTRHGKTTRSDPEQYLGQRLDVALSDLGRASAERLRDRLADVPLDRILSSPLKRALDTAHILRPGETVEADARLAEADYGEWEGHTTPEILARWPEIRRAWEEDPTSIAPPGGESGADVARRVSSLIADLVGWEAGLGAPERQHRVLLVGHSTLNRVLLAVVLGVPVRDYRRRFRQDWTNLTVLKYVTNTGAELVLGNDVAHVRGIHGITWD
jgi:broad specificity phosphatase PhoE